MLKIQYIDIAMVGMLVMSVAMYRYEPLYGFIVAFGIALIVTLTNLRVAFNYHYLKIEKKGDEYGDNQHTQT